MMWQARCAGSMYPSRKYAPADILDRPKYPLVDILDREAS